MRAFFERHRKQLLTAMIVLVALLVGYQVWRYYEVEPRTRDGKVRADVVPVAADVAGYVTEVRVIDNQQVNRGDVLFLIDPERYRIALAQAEAALSTAGAARRQAEQEQRRYRALRGVVSPQRVEQIETAAQQAEAAYAQASAALDLARLNLERSTVRASVDGIVTNLTLLPGRYLTAGTAAVALVDRNSIHVAGYFEETKLPRIRVGDRARVRLMGEREILMGRVEGIAAAIDDRERSTGEGLLPNVNPTFPWVRLAQRIPVRITLDQPPADVKLVAGRTATVEILPPDR